MTDVVRIHGLAHGDGVWDPALRRYGVVLAHGVISAVQPTLDAQWESRPLPIVLPPDVATRVRVVPPDLPRPPRAR